MNAADDSLGSVQSALHQALLGQCEVGVGACDSDGVLTVMNSALEEIVGERYSPTRHDRWAGCYHLYDERGLNQLGPGNDPLARALRGHRIVDEVVSVRPPGQPIRFIRCNAAPLHGMSGEALGAVVFVVEVTRQVTARQQLDELRDRLVETVNHEMRTPLATVVGHIELLHDDSLDLPLDTRWSLGAVNRAAVRLREVVDAISELANLAATRAGASNPVELALADRAPRTGPLPVA